MFVNLSGHAIRSEKVVVPIRHLPNDALPVHGRDSLVHNANIILAFRAVAVHVDKPALILRRLQAGLGPLLRGRQPTPPPVQVIFFVESSGLVVPLHAHAAGEAHLSRGVRR